MKKTLIIDVLKEVSNSFYEMKEISLVYCNSILENNELTIKYTCICSTDNITKIDINKITDIFKTIKDLSNDFKFNFRYSILSTEFLTNLLEETECEEINELKEAEIIYYRGKKNPYEAKMNCLKRIKKQNNAEHI